MSSNGESLLSELFEYFKEKYFTPHLDDYSHLSVSANMITTVTFGLFIGINIAALLAIFNKRVLGDFVRTLISHECFSPQKAKTLSELGFIKNSSVRGSLRSGVTLKRVVHCREEEEYYAELDAKRNDRKSPPPDTISSESQSSGGNSADDASADLESAEIGASDRRNLVPPVVSSPPVQTGDVSGNAHDAAVNMTESSEPKTSALTFRETRYKIDLNTAHFYIPEELKYTADIKFDKKGTNILSYFVVLILSSALVLLAFRFIPNLLQSIDKLISSFYS